MSPGFAFEISRDFADSFIDVCMEAVHFTQVWPPAPTVYAKEETAAGNPVHYALLFVNQKLFERPPLAQSKLWPDASQLSVRL